MNKNLRYIVLLIMLTAASLTEVAASDIKQLLNSYREASGLEIVFESGEQNYTIKSFGTKYKLQSKTIDILYDNVDLYSYNSATNELTIEKLSNQNVMTNPTLIFGLDNNEFNFEIAGNICTITPKDREKVGLEKIVITTKSGAISSISIKPLESEDKIVLNIASIREVKEIDAKEFKFNKKTHPDAEIIDFR